MAAALRLQGKDVVMLDVGKDAPDVPSQFDGDLLQLREQREDLFDLLVGKQFQALENIYRRPKTSLKLKAPFMRFITDGWRELTPINTVNFGGVLSLAKGGLANGWGAGVYRFTDHDLKGFPFGYKELAGYYDVLTRHIGVSGINDDLTCWFHQDPDLQPPLRLGVMAHDLHQRYSKNRSWFNLKGLYIGRPRLAVLTQPHNGRQPYPYDHMEFFKAHCPAIYSPSYTIDSLVAERHLDYRPGVLVDRFESSESGVIVHARDLSSDVRRTFQARKLMLGAGALNTARIVLGSAGDTSTRLPILDNPMSAFPLLRLDRIGLSVDECDSSIAQLNFIFKPNESEQVLQSTLYSTNGSARSDVIFDLPLPVKSARNLLKQTASCTSMVLTFHPGVFRPANFVQLRDDGSLAVNCASEPERGDAEENIIQLLRKIGYLSHAALIQRLPLGSALHYACLLPMKDRPARYECFPDGELQGNPGVHVIDGACFSALPAKNLTFTIMANSMRIADSVAESLS
jgi:choline dehydrogenase-like flavoprotein